MDAQPEYDIIAAQNATDEQKLAVAEILSSHWRKDPQTRVAELSKSTDSFPLHLLLLRRASNGLFIGIGHCRLTKVDGAGEIASLIESVIVDKSERSKGLGRLLMSAAEKAAKERGYKVMYLNTKDKMAFYAHLGYSECAPVTCLGATARLLNQEQLNGLTSVFGATKSPTAENGVSSSAKPVSSKDKLGCTWMKKTLV